MFDEGKDIGQDLAGMVLVGQAVYHGDPRVGGETLDDVVAEGADHDDVAHPRHYFAGIFHRLAAAELAVARVEINGSATELMHAGFKRQTGTGRVLFEHHDQRAVDQRMMRLVILEFPLDHACAFEHVVEFLEREIGKLQEVSDCHNENGGEGRACRRSVEAC